MSQPAAALQLALAAEHAAVWGYAVVGSVLAEGMRDAVVAVQSAHRELRDDTAARLRSLGADPVQALPGYALPFTVEESAAALALAALLEDGTAAAWRYVLGATDDVLLRGTALTALTGSAVQAVRWRLAAGTSPTTVAFPGQG